MFVAKMRHFRRGMANPNPVCSHPFMPFVLPTRLKPGVITVTLSGNVSVDDILAIFMAHVERCWR
jgi:hypothetical protein